MPRNKQPKRMFVLVEVEAVPDCTAKDAASLVRRHFEHVTLESLRVLQVHVNVAQAVKPAAAT